VPVAGFGSQLADVQRDNGTVAGASSCSPENAELLARGAEAQR
jgi:hypothetical protein